MSDIEHVGVIELPVLSLVWSDQGGECGARHTGRSAAPPNQPGPAVVISGAYIAGNISRPGAQGG